MARTPVEKELSKKRVNGLILFIDILLILYVIAVILVQVSPEFKELINEIFNR